MEPMKLKSKETFMPANEEESFGGRRANANILEEWEIRPGGMLVQNRSSPADSNKNSVSVSTIKVSVKYGSSCHEIRISSQASFGELKKMLAEHTGVHPQDQKLIYKKKERDSKAFLDVARVKTGSKIVLIEDITSREKRRLEMLKSAGIEKASKFLQQNSLEVDQLGKKVTALETTTSKEGKAAEEDVDDLTEMLMAKLVALDGMFVVGDLELQKRMQEKRVQQYIETLDRQKLNNYSTANSNGGRIPSQQQENSILQVPKPMQNQPIHSNGSKIPLQKQENSTGNLPIPMQKQPPEFKQQNATVQKQKQPPQKQQQPPPRHSESVVVTTKWETFD